MAWNANYNSTYNIWKQFDDNYAPGDVINGKAVTEVNDNNRITNLTHTKGNSEWSIEVAGERDSTDRWQRWLHITPYNTIKKIENGKKYEVSMVINTTKDVSIVMKLEDNGDTGNYLLEETIDLKAGQNTLKKEYRGTKKGVDISNVQLAMGLGFADDGTVVTISNIYIAEVNVVGFTHFEGYAYSGKFGTDIPDNLIYAGGVYKTHADDSRIKVGADPIQRSHELIKDVWVIPGNNVELLPFTDFKTATQYYEKYTRWYDYTTGKGIQDSKIDPAGAEFFYRSEWGIFGGEALTGDRKNATSLLYKSDASATGEILDIIAMDASCDFTTGGVQETDGRYVITEPNIHFRVVFVIRNAKSRAELMSNATTGPRYVADHKEKLMAPEGTPFQYRLQSPERWDFPNEYKTDFWYKTGENTYEAVHHYLVETWKKDETGKYVKRGWTINSKDGASFPSGKPSNINELAMVHKSQNYIDRVFYIQNPEAGDYQIKIYAIENNLKNNQPQPIYYYGTAADEANRMLLMEYDLEIMPLTKGNMITEDELNTNPDYAHQTPANLEHSYGEPTTVVNFDDVRDTDTKASNNGLYYKWPRKWEESSYGFGYDKRNDYNMYVVANYSNTTPYHAGCDTTGIKYDRLYYDTKGTQQGYFYYTNAAGDPGRMTILNIGRDFCANTTVYVSAWVMEFSQTSETANVVFSFKGVETDGTETTLSSFATGYVTGGNNKYSNGTNPDHRGLWHHVYYSFKPEMVDATKFDHYIISVENNCVNSSGADYAIDDIRAYVVKPTIRAQQLEPLCDGKKETKLLMTSPWDDVVNAFAVEVPSTSDKTKTTKVDYCFLDKEKYDKEMEGYKDPTKTTDEKRAIYINAFNTALIKGTYIGGENTYGILEFYNFYTDNEVYDQGKDYSGELNKATRMKILDEETLVFPSKATDNDMVPGKTYIVAMRSHYGDTTPDAEAFQMEEKCSAVSQFTVITSGVIKIDGEMMSDQQDEEYCSNLTPIITIDMTGISNLGVIQETKNSYFDWYFGSYENYRNAQFNSIYLSDAMEVFRNKYPTIKYEQFDAEARVDNEFTAADRACIKHFIEAGDLVLYKNQEVISTYDHFNKPSEGTDRVYVTAIPINPTPERTDIRYCLNPLEISIKVSKRKPSMLNGDDKKDFYPVAMRVVPLRIGLTQLNSVRIDELGVAPKNVLYMPLREVTCTAEGVHKLKMAKDRDIYLIASDDPQIQAGTSGAKDIENTDVKVIGSVNKIEADAENRFQEKNFSELAFLKDFKFREGYEYTIKFRFDEEHESTSGEQSDICPGDVVCIIKVVPEYQMWTGEVNSNWNNDRNWRRVSSAELLGTAAATADFVTDGGTNDNTRSFVPADFTKVIIPADAENVPKLYNVREGSNLEEIHYPQGTGTTYFIKNMAADSHIGDVTTNINYDMSSINKNNHIACRSWYDHTCQYIHFNSEAQMLSQQNLFYEKAWADFEVEPNKWSTVGSPLINVVSGDLYLPTATARQDTPLFEDITFDANLHDRFHPAVFQRRWNAEGAKILHLDKTVTSAMVALDWSEVYNDVNVNYTSGVGFSIKPDVSMMPAGKQPAKVKFRLPKGDTDYWYWNPDHKDGNVNHEIVRLENDSLINGERTHRLANLKNVYAQQVVQNDPSTNYFLIGNPLMCYLDMKRFFDENSDLERKYWIVTGKGQQYAQFDQNTEGYVGNVDNQYVAPFQSFFVKLTGTSSATFKPKFNNEMMVAKLANGYESVTAQVTSNPAKEGFLTVCAEDEDGNESTMMLTDGADLQVSGIEALFDSNLRQSGYPMVYGSVRGEAMSLTTIMPGDTIPVAVSGLRGMTTLKLKGAEEFTTDLYVIDSETGESRLLTSDMELTQETSGVRYYIAAEPTDIDSEFVALLPQLKVEGNTLKVFPPEGETIESIHIYQVGGALVAAESNISGAYSINLKNDVYLIAIKYNGRALNYKIVI